MIKVNLLPVKKRKKAKPLPAFLVSTILITAITGAVLIYVIYIFNSTVSARRIQVAANEKKIAELKAKIKSVEDYEKRNADYKQRKEIIEQLSKNKTLPVKIVDEISALLPAGVWLNVMSINGHDISLSCTGFTNTDVVNYVNNLKSAKMFTDVYLQESVQGNISGFSVYGFRLTFKVKA
jgi:type IV pilus assembly protein PilN